MMLVRTLTQKWRAPNDVDLYAYDKFLMKNLLKVHLQNGSTVQ